MNGDLGLFPNDLEFEIEFNIFLKLQDIKERIIERIIILQKKKRAK